MLERIVFTEPGIGAAILRCALGAVMLPHGLQKLVGWFGGFGFKATMEFFVSQGIPAPAALFVIAAESLGAFALILGIGTRPAALAIGAVMMGAAIFQAKNGFFMNWYGNQSGEGFEYHILMIAMSLALVISGGGALSLDALIAERLK